MEDCIWKRDPNIPNGTTWSQFQRSTREDKILHFRIQDLTEQFENECIKYMIKYFAREEQFTKSLSKSQFFTTRLIIFYKIFMNFRNSR